MPRTMRPRSNPAPDAPDALASTAGAVRSWARALAGLWPDVAEKLEAAAADVERARRLAQIGHATIEGVRSAARAARDEITRPRGR